MDNLTSEKVCPLCDGTKEFFGKRCVDCGATGTYAAYAEFHGFEVAPSRTPPVPPIETATAMDPGDGPTGGIVWLNPPKETK